MVELVFEAPLRSGGEKVTLNVRAESVPDMKRGLVDVFNMPGSSLELDMDALSIVAAQSWVRLADDFVAGVGGVVAGVNVVDVFPEATVVNSATGRGVAEHAVPAVVDVVQEHAHALCVKALAEATDAATVGKMAAEYKKKFDTQVDEALLEEMRNEYKRLVLVEREAKRAS